MCTNRYTIVSTHKMACPLYTSTLFVSVFYKFSIFLPFLQILIRSLVTSVSCQSLIGLCLLKDPCMLKGQAYPKPKLSNLQMCRNGYMVLVLGRRSLVLASTVAS